MRKGFILALVFVFGMAMAVSVAMAANNVGTTSQKGSLVILPKIDVSGNRDTLVSISNDMYLPVNVSCYWVNGLQEYTDFHFLLTKDQPITFSAKSGFAPFPPPRYIDGTVVKGTDVGELKCFASDDSYANQIAWNHLMASAKVIDYDRGTAYSYNAWSFQTRTGTQGNPVGTAGEIRMDGAEYDACPQYFLGNFQTKGADYGSVLDTNLTLVPCKQDLRQDRNPTITKAKFDVWNQNERKYTAATACMKCWFEKYLDSIHSNFKLSILQTGPARFRVSGIKSTVCPGSAPTPLIGLLVEQRNVPTTNDGSIFTTTALTGFGSGIDPTGFVLYDPGQAVVPTAAR